MAIQEHFSVKMNDSETECSDFEKKTQQFWIPHISEIFVTNWVRVDLVVGIAKSNNMHDLLYSDSC